MNSDQEIILAHILDVDRSFFITHPQPKLTPIQKNELNDALHQLKNNTPLPYILGYKEFYKRKFIVNKNTLIPRPESESIIDLVKKHITPQTIICDIGTGSGCLAITAQLETNANVFASDISHEALHTAQENNKLLKSTVIFKQGNVAEPLLPIIQNNEETMIITNLPYIPEHEYNDLDDHVKNEPKQALTSGTDGLDHYRELFHQLHSQNNIKHYFCEISPSNHTKFISIAQTNFPQATITTHYDLAGIPRIVHIHN